MVRLERTPSDLAAKGTPGGGSHPASPGVSAVQGHGLPGKDGGADSAAAALDDSSDDEDDADEASESSLLPIGQSQQFIPRN